MKRTFCALFFVVGLLPAQHRYYESAVKYKNTGMTDLEAYSMLDNFTTTVGHRFSGSPGYEKAVAWAKAKLQEIGSDSVWLEPVMIPHWERGKKEWATMMVNGRTTEIAVCALGGSVATPSKGIQSQVIEVRSLEEARLLGEKARGKIIFFNRPFDKTMVNTFAAYGEAVDQRGRGAVEGAKLGAIGVLVRSMNTAIDRHPHTGAMRYYDSIPKIPAAAISTLDADRLSEALKGGSIVNVRLTMECKTFPDVPSHNVISEIRGTEYPDEIVLIGAHLDSWDKGTGAHDDGSGVVQCIDALRLMKKLGMKPKRTIRCVLFANEENGIRGARAYAAGAQASSVKHIAAIESDEGGSSPRGFSVTGDSVQYEKILGYRDLLEIVGAEKITKGGGGVDIDQLKTKGTVLIGLQPDNQRYFEYHHSDIDTIDKVHPRELQLGSIAMGIIAWCLAQDGI